MRGTKLHRTGLLQATTALALALLVAMLLGACGGDDQATAERPDPAAAALLVVQDLPEDAEEDKNPAEPCDSLSIIKSSGSKVAASRAFSTSELSLSEAAGVYDVLRRATVAFYGLISEARGRCFQNRLSDLLPGAKLEARKIPSSTIPAADEGLLQRYVVRGPGQKLVAILSIASMRVDYCAAGIVAVDRFDEPDPEVMEEVSRTAARKLGAACPEKRR